MKRATFVILHVVLASMLLGACQASPQPAAPDSKPSVGSEEPVVTDNDAVYLSDFLAGEAFDAARTRIEQEGNVPNNLHFYFANSADGDIRGKENILRFWQRICGVEIDTHNPESELAIDDGTALFTFSWADGMQQSFTFCTSEYYDDQGTLYPVAHQALVSSILNEAYDLVTYGEEESTALRIENDRFSWDYNLDGVDEQFFINFTNNGDEAPNVMEFFDEEGVLEAAHLSGINDLNALYAKVNENGQPYLLVDYVGGDYYDDYPAQAKIVVRNNALVLEEI